ncbi:MAG: PPC domain-containing protein [Planctomycetaceae bacterium]
MLCCLLRSGELAAQPKPGYSPSSTHLFPAGARRGTSIPVRVGAECIPPGTDFLITGRGLTGSGRLFSQVFSPAEKSPRRVPTITPITYPREWAADLTIDADAPLGPVYWRLNCAQGGTASRPFLIGDLPEYIETESNSSIELAERVTLPVTLNGQIHGERDVDCFRFTAEAGQVISCEVIAGRIGSRLDPVIELLDSNGRTVEARLSHLGSDPVVVFRSDSTAEYILRISNVTFAGDPAHVYRINIRPEPFPRLMLPGGVHSQAPGPIDLQLFSLNGSRTMLETPFRFRLPEESTGQQTWTVHDSRMGPFCVSLDNHPAMVEQEPNADPTTAQVVRTPAVLYGQFESASDRDCFRFAAVQGAPLRIEASAWPPGTPALPVLAVIRPDGKTAREVRSVLSADGIARIIWTPKKDEDVLLQLQDLRYGARGGMEFSYRLLIAPDAPDFSLEAATDSLIVTQGKSSKLKITARRNGGMDGAIQLTFDGLPAGVTVTNAEIPPGKISADIEFSARDNARSASFPVRVSGECSLKELTLKRVARFRHLGVDSEGVAVGSPATETLHLSTQHKPLFRLFCPEAYLYAHRGSVFPYPMEVERLNGFDGPIHIQQGDRQNRDMDGVEMLQTLVKTGRTDFFLPIYLPETMSINVQSQTQLYSQAWAHFSDSYGQEQAMLVLSEKRNMLRSMPPVVKLQAIDSSLSAIAGATVTCRLRLQRTSNFDGTMDVELRNPSTETGLTMQSSGFAAGADELTVSLLVPRGQAPGPLSLRFRATGQLKNRRIISEARVLLQIRQL